jgi:organic radical activating enzyme
MSNTFCVLPWMHVCIRPDNNLKPCCRYNPETIYDTINLEDLYVNKINAMNSAHMIELRKNMLNNQWDKGCAKCLMQEQNNVTSMRQFMNYRYNFVDIKNLSDNFEKIRYIEMSLDNICNLECKMCSSEFSTKLIKRDKALGNKVYKKLEPNFKKLDNVDLSELYWIKILGGEPFISPNFEKFLDYIIFRSNPEEISIEISSNTSVIPSKNIIDKLNLFKKIYINISIDSYDKSNDYQRFGGSYKTTYDNSLIYSKLFYSIHISYHCTISILNANKFETLIEKVNQNNNISFDFVRYPLHLSLKYVPSNFYDWLLDEVKNKTAIKLILSIKSENKYNEKIWNDFLTKTKFLDEYYKVNLEDYNYSLYQFLNKNYNYGNKK